jgi:predicted PP-loop superfamily ATPase
LFQAGAVDRGSKIVIGRIEVAASGGQASMSQDALDLRKMSTVMEQSTSKAVTEHMRCKVVEAIC